MWTIFLSCWLFLRIIQVDGLPLKQYSNTNPQAFASRLLCALGDSAHQQFNMLESQLNACDNRARAQAALAIWRIDRRRQCVQILEDLFAKSGPSDTVEITPAFAMEAYGYDPPRCMIHGSAEHPILDWLDCTLDSLRNGEYGPLQLQFCDRGFHSMSDANQGNVASGIVILTESMKSRRLGFWLLRSQPHDRKNFLLTIDALGEIGPAAHSALPRLMPLVISEDGEVANAASAAIWRIRKSHYLIDFIRR